MVRSGFDCWPKAMQFVRARHRAANRGARDQTGAARGDGASGSTHPLLGFRSDAELIEDYANARAVAFLPYDEDYGLITIEAMMSRQAVLTTTDSGGAD
jgi:glycosyltransferase involved in cell wall biosynthesis